MSEHGKAVFLSYASQDAEAAKRIAEALRAAGVEVWFDQSELRGGDAWDAMIRRRIKECALFVPVITPNTNARAEGYFRLEWKLAVDRSHLMADDAPFLFPIVIGDVSDATARVPDKFREVQWTRLRLDETPGELAGRVARLLSGGSQVGGVLHPDGSGRSGHKAPPTGHAARWQWWMIFPVLGTIMGLLFAAVPLWKAFNRPARREPPAVAPAATPPVAAMSPARQLAEKARVLLDAIDSSPDDYATAEGLVKRALELEQNDGEIWAISSRLNSMFMSRAFDNTGARREPARSQAERALKLAPDSVESLLAVARANRSTDAPRAEAALRQALALAPQNGRVLLNLGSLFRVQNRLDEAMGYYEQAAAVPEVRPLARYDQFLVSFYRRKFADAERYVQDAVTELPTANAVTGLAMVQLTWRGQPEAALRVLAAAPGKVRAEPRPVIVTVLAAQMNRQPEVALAALRRFPADYVNDAWYFGPKALLVGLCEWQAGRPEAARVAWESGIALLRRRMQDSPNNAEEHLRLGELLAWSGQTEAALGEVRVYEQLMSGRTVDWTASPARVYAALGRADEAVPLLAQELVAPPSGRWPLTPALLRLDPLWDKIRDDARFQKLCADPPTPAATSAANSTTVSSAALAKEDKSIAVLLFTNMSEDKDANAFFADGVHEDLLTNLSFIRDLRVVSRTSVMQYRNTTKSISEIARELKVAYVLEGSVRRAGNKVRVTGQLIRAATDEHVWASNYDRDLADVFSIQAELAKSIAAALQSVLSPATAALLERKPTNNPAAYDVYLRARQLDYSTQYSDGREVIALLRRAVELDPGFAAAWAALAYREAFRYFKVEHTPAQLALAEAAVNRAVQLAPDDPAVVTGLGDYYYYGHRDYVRATEQYLRLAQLQPNNPDIFSKLGYIQRRQGRMRDALPNFRRASELDPRTQLYLSDYIWSLAGCRKYDEAERLGRQFMQAFPDDLYVPANLGRIELAARGSFAAMRAFAARPVAQAQRPEHLYSRLFNARAAADWTEAIRLDREQRYFDGDDDTPRFLQDVLAAATFAEAGDDAACQARAAEALAAMNTLLTEQPLNAQLWGALSLAHGLLGHHDDAVRCGAKARELLPESRDALTGVGISGLVASALAYAGETDRALAEFERLLHVPFGANPMLERGIWLGSWKPLRADPRFQRLINDPQNNAPLFQP